MNKLPNHIAFILDGNRRWAKSNKVTVIEGHKAGLEAIRKIIEQSISFKIKHISLYAFSTENWNRTTTEKKLLFGLFSDVLKNEINNLLDRGVKLIHIGRKDRLPLNLKKLLKSAEEKSRNNNKLVLNLAIDYGAKDEIVRATNKIIESDIKEINEDTFSKFLDMKDNYPDLLVRTSDEHRLSNFLLWQLAYAEIIFVEKLLPDYTVENYIETLKEYSKRERRFGR